MGRNSRRYAAAAPAAAAAPIDPAVESWRAYMRTTRAPMTLLFDQQLWALGCDVRHAPNLLCLRGFARVPSPDVRCTRYTMPVGGQVISLWGRGVFVSEAGCGVYLSRQRWSPGFTRAVLADGTAPLPALERLSAPCVCEYAQAAGLIAAVCRWFAAYEVWVAETAGADYRAETVARWAGARKPWLPAAEMPARWAVLAEAAADYASGRSPETGLSSCHSLPIADAS
jgi:hypothetical protein